jgi:oligoribonuclease
MKKYATLLWTDLETPGLEHDEPWSAIFEAGFVLTDAFGVVLGEYSIVPQYPSNFLDYSFAKMDKVCTEMHTKSGLIEDLRDAQMPEVDDFEKGHKKAPAESWMQSIRTYPMMRAMYLTQEALEEMDVPYGTHKLTMAGASPHFDRRWLANFWPSVEEGFHYRNFDVSTIRKAVALLRPDLAKNEPEKRGSHRVLDDIHDAIRYYQWAQEFFFSKGGIDAWASTS